MSPMNFKNFAMCDSNLSTSFNYPFIRIYWEIVTVKVKMTKIPILKNKKLKIKKSEKKKKMSDPWPPHCLDFYFYFEFFTFFNLRA